MDANLSVDGTRESSKHLGLAARLQPSRLPGQLMSRPPTILILGDVVIRHGPSDLRSPGGPMPRALLSLLASSAGSVVDLIDIEDALWGPAASSNTRAGIQVVVSRLRSVLRPLGADIVRGATGYQLLLGPGLASDVDLFRQAVTQARVSLAERDFKTVLIGSCEGLALWRGRPFQDVVSAKSFGDHVNSGGASLEDQRCELVEMRAEALIALGRAKEAISLLEPLIEAYPFRENAVAQQMLALYQGGRQADALRCYNDLRRGLGDELGLEPGPRLRSLEVDLLQQNPLLDAVDDGRGVSTLQEQLFVGRDVEQQRITSALKSGRHLTILGPAGSGKSTLIQQLGALPVGRCHEMSGTPPFWPWQSVMADLESQLARMSRSVEEVQRARKLLEQGNTDGVFRVSIAVVEALRSAAGFVAGVVIEDLQWAGPSAMQLLRFAITEVKSGPAILSTSRSVEAASGNGAVTIELGPLSRAAIAEVLRRRIGLPASDRLIDQVVSRTSGIALLVDRAAKAAIAGESFELFEKEEILEHWIGDLGQTERQVIEIAALIGERFDATLVIEVLAKIDSAGSRQRSQQREVVLIAIDHCVQSGLIRNSEGTFSFWHALLRIALVEGIGPGRRAELRFQLANCLMERTDGDRNLPEIATHLALAQLVTPAETILDYCLRAAQQARGLGAHEEARTFLAWAIEASAKVDLDIEARLRIELAAGEVMWLAGDVAASRDRYAAAGQLLADSDPRLLDVAASYVGFGLAGVDLDDRGIALLDRALRFEVGSEHQAASLRCRTRQVIGLWDDDTVAQASKNLYRQAQHTADPKTTIWALGAVLLSSMTMQGAQARYGHAVDLTVLGHEIGSDNAVALGLVHQADSLAELGHFDTLPNVLDHIAQMAGATSRPAHRWYEMHYRAALLIAQGRFGEGDSLSQQALSVGQDSHMSSAFEAYSASLFVNHYSRGRSHELLAFTDISVDPTQNMRLGLNAWHLGIGLCLVDDNQIGAARERLQIVMQGAGAARRDRVRSIELAQLIDLGVQLGNLEAVEFGRGWLAEHSGRCCAASGMTLAGAADVYLGLADMALGNGDNGHSLLSKGIEQNRRWGLHSWVEFGNRRLALVDSR